MEKTYDGKKFKSTKDLIYYKELLENDDVLTIYMNIKEPLIKKYGNYTPTFIVEYKTHYELVDIVLYTSPTKSKTILILNEIAQKSPLELEEYISSALGYKCDKRVIYRKLRYVKSLGFVNYDYDYREEKKRKQKQEIKSIYEEVKILRAKVREYEKFINLMNKGDKLRRDEKRWLNEFKDNHNATFMKRRKIDEN